MKRFKGIGMVVLCLMMLGYIFYQIGKHELTKRLLKSGGIRARAVIIDEKNFKGNSPVSHEYSFSYLFYVDGKAYKNDSKDPELKVGDSVDVEYVKERPSVSRLVSAP